MKKQTFKLLMISVLLVSLCGCKSTEPVKAEDLITTEKYVKSIYGNPPRVDIDTSGVGDLAAIINNKDSYKKLAKTEVDIHKFAEKYGANSGYYGNSHIQEVADDIGIECLRYIEDGALYSVHKVKQGGLIYIFYHTHIYEETKNIDNIWMNEWFYVTKKLSSSDFQKIEIGKSTIKDIMKIDPGEQIWENIFYSNIEMFADYHGMISWHYLQDGIFYIQYKYVDGEIVVDYMHLEETFNLDDTSLSIYQPYDAHILDMDWIKR